jgi:hypothetical protein
MHLRTSLSSAKPVVRIEKFDDPFFLKIRTCRQKKLEVLSRYNSLTGEQK